jgi:hypothetical protein
MQHTCAIESSVASRFTGFDADASFREDYLHVMAGFGLGRREAAILVEACTGHVFSTFHRVEFVPVLDELLAVAWRTASRHRNGTCGD